MKILITENANERLREIYYYHRTVASLAVAKKIKNFILSGVPDLKNFGELGTLDPHLKYLNQGHRKLIRGNYKIEYTGWKTK
jgi:toxin ParE1/3/4